MEHYGAEPSTVDAHVHVWDLGTRPQPWIDPRTMGVLDRTYQPDDLRTVMLSNGVSTSVLVQVLNDAEESDDLMWAGAGRPFAGVVPWLDLLAQDLEHQLGSLLNHASGAQVVGIRHQALAERDPARWLMKAAEGRGFGLLGRHGLAFDLMLAPAHLAAAEQVVAAHAGTTFVLDHAGKPPVTTGWSSTGSQRWAAAVGKLGRLPNVVCKLSGLTTLAGRPGWGRADLQPYVDHLLGCFGADRVMFGSDWPVSLRAGSYSRTVETAHALVGALSAGEQEAVLSRTARRVYGLPDPARS
jgi:L-fuconolactonase